MPVNVDLLLKVRDHILADPEHFLMRSFVEKTDCGTACCIAGWAVALSDPGGTDVLLDWDNTRIYDSAVNLLGVSDGLFFTAAWPSQFSSAYRRARIRGDEAGMARAAVDRIDHFLLTEGRE